MLTSYRRTESILILKYDDEPQLSTYGFVHRIDTIYSADLFLQESQSFSQDKYLHHLTNFRRL